MFTFFLLVGRFLEMRLRHRNQQLSSNAADLLPHTANRIDEQASETVIPLLALAVGDHVKVYAGDSIPCDGEIISGESCVSEALLTGEANPLDKKVGDTVIGGTLNVEDTLVIRVSAVGEQTRLSMITCPCALSLATPTALTAAVSVMRQRGLLVIKGHVVESLASINRIIFDKTGTLTVGQPVIVNVIPLSDHVNKDDVIAIAASLEQYSNHPLAFAFKSAPIRYRPRDVQTTPSQGISGKIDNKVFRLGKPSYAVYGEDPPPLPDEHGQWLLLGCDSKAIAWIGLDDQLRSSAVTAVEQLQANDARVCILSGDNVGTVSKMAQQLGVNEYLSGQLPEQKLDYVRQLQQDPMNKVLMVGDGVNDVPVLAGANVSVAMDSASDFARTSADSVLLNDDLTVLPAVIALAKKTRRVIKQNISWAVLYNVSALPLAAMGFIPPYLAAIGMSLSSLIVVINALRLHKV